MSNNSTTQSPYRLPHTWVRPSGRPLIIGHRGSPLAERENTLASFLRAIQDGADGVELDVHLTRDHQLAVHHDSSLTVGNATIALSTLTLNELRELHAPGKSENHLARVPTLNEVFETLPYGLINIELKSFSVRPSGLENAVTQAIRESGAFERVVVSSFNPISLLRIQKLSPHLQLGLLFAPDLARPLSHTWLLPLLDRRAALHPREDMLAPASPLLKQHRPLRSWTVNDAARAQELATLGVNALITDVPAALQSALT